jgi:hypothetical protein
MQRKQEISEGEKKLEEIKKPGSKGLHFRESKVQGWKGLA